MKHLTAALFTILFMGTASVQAEPVKTQNNPNSSGFEAPYFANVPHPGFSDPQDVDKSLATLSAEEAAIIAPAAGEPDTDMTGEPVTENTESLPESK